MEKASPYQILLFNNIYNVTLFSTSASFISEEMNQFCFFMEPDKLCRHFWQMNLNVAGKVFRLSLPTLLLRIRHGKIECVPRLQNTICNVTDTDSHFQPCFPFVRCSVCKPFPLLGKCPCALNGRNNGMGCPDYSGHMQEVHQYSVSSFKEETTQRLKKTGQFSYVMAVELVHIFGKGAGPFVFIVLIS